jgi:Na+-transporting methylmalonyl-CoA/oxaloacetate decarboxylase beta subunit
LKVKKVEKIIIALTVATSIITIISASWKFIMRLYIQYRFQIDTDNSASSIGIIGGADGPTSIFISGYPYSGIFTIIFALLSVAGVVYLLVIRKVNHR